MRFAPVLVLCLLWSLCTVQAQFDKSTFGTEPIVLKHADSLLGTTSEAGMVRRVVGNVMFVQGNVTVTCNEAVQYIDRNHLELIGDVVITQNSVTLRTSRGEYDGNTRIAMSRSGVHLTDRDTKLSAREGRYSTTTQIADFYRDVVVENDSLIVYSDTLEYHRDTQNSYATGSVAAFGKHSSVRIYGDSLSNFPGQRYMRVSGGSPLFCQVDTVRIAPTDSLPAPGMRLDTLCIAGDLLEAFRTPGSERYIATGNVRLTRGQLAARSASGMYNHSNEHIQLIGEPVIWMDSTQLSADSIAVILRDRSLEQIAAYRNAFAATRNAQTQRVDQLTGENIFIAVAQDTLRRITAENKAFSLYFLYNEGQPDGASRSSADNITIDLDQGQASNVYWTGKVDGEYLPEALLFGRVEEYYLRGFRWLTNRPHLSAADTRRARASRPSGLQSTDKRKK